MAFDHVSVIKFHHLVFIFLCLQAVSFMVISSASYNISKPGCVNKCGDISIPYPFGIGGDENCYMGEYFSITCNETLNPPKAYYGNLELLDIDLRGQLRANALVASDCYNKDGSQKSNIGTTAQLGRFTFSDTRNKFVAIGCDTLAYITGADQSFTSGCVSICNNTKYVINGSCNGFGCCQTSIPTGLKNYSVDVETYHNHTKVWDFNPCSYAFLAEENWFNFSSLDLKDNPQRSEVPVVIDWAVGDQTCEEAKKNSTGTYSCGVNSYCYNPSNGNGYRCNCSNGYEGNPYLINGCQGTASKRSVNAAVKGSTPSIIVAWVVLLNAFMVVLVM